MKKLRTLLASFVVLAVVVASGILVTGCGGGGNEPKETGLHIAAQRYEATPVNEEGYRIDYSYTDGNYDYHYINLGKVEWMPISSGDMWYYGGKVPIKLTYTIKEGDSGSFTTAITDAWNKTTHTTNTWSSTAYTEGSVSVGGGPLIPMKISAKVGLSGTWGGSKTLDDNTSHSDTSTTFNGWAKEHSETMEFYIGNDVKDVGYYRFSVFATCDAYAIAVRDRKTSEYYRLYDFCARPGSLFSTIDYSPINFDDVVYGKKLKISDDVFNELVEQEVTLTRTVKFMDGETTLKTELVKHGGYATAPAYASTETKSFKGWTLDGETVVDVNSIDITTDTTFKALWKEKTWQTVYLNTWYDAPRCLSVINLAELTGVQVPTNASHIKITVTGKMTLVSNLDNTKTSDVNFDNTLLLTINTIGTFQYEYQYSYYPTTSSYSTFSQLTASFSYAYVNNIFVVSKTSDSSINLETRMDESFLAITRIEFFM